MAYERAIRHVLTHERHVRAAMGGRKAIYPLGEVPQNTRRPYVTIQAIGQVGTTNHQGGAGSLRGDEVLVTCWAGDYSAAVELRGHVKGALVGLAGTFDGETIQGIFEASRRADADDTIERSEHGLQAASMTLAVWHTEI